MALILKGAARQPDLNNLVATIWTKCAQLNLEVQWDYVPSKANIADGPSRKDFVATDSLRAESVDMQWPTMVKC